MPIKESKVIRFLNIFMPGNFLLIAGLPASAQQVIGTAVINGKIVEILENQTWRYKSEQSMSLSGCDLLKNGLYFCNKNNWKTTSATGDASHMYSIDDRTYVMFIIENMGADDGVTKDFMAGVALNYAAEAANTTPDNILQHFSRDKIVNGNEFLSIAYTASISNIKFTFINNICVQDTVTAQAAIFTLGSKVTESQIEHNNVLVENLFFTK